MTHPQSVYRKKVTISSVDHAAGLAIVTWSNGLDADEGFPWFSNYLPVVGDVAFVDLVAGSPVIVSSVQSDGTGGDAGGGWHTVGAVGEAAFAGSWTNSGGSNRVAGYRRDAMGVALAGWVKSTGSESSGTTLFTLPTYFRPSDNVVFGTVAKTSLNVETPVRVAVNASGTVQLVGATATWADLGLDLVRFTIDGPA